MVIEHLHLVNLEYLVISFVIRIVFCKVKVKRPQRQKLLKTLQDTYRKSGSVQTKRKSEILKRSAHSKKSVEQVRGRVREIKEMQYIFTVYLYRHTSSYSLIVKEHFVWFDH